MITDYTMPHLTGIDLAKRMMSLRPDIPIILCTGFSQQVSAELTREIGVKKFLMKPLLLPEVALAVRTVLDEREAL